METTSRMVYIYYSNITNGMLWLKEQRKFTWAQFTGFANVSPSAKCSSHRICIYWKLLGKKMLRDATEDPAQALLSKADQKEVQVPQNLD